MKFLKKYIFITLPTLLMAAMLSINSLALASQEEFESLVMAIQNDDFDTFQELLQSGVNPNFIGEELGSPVKWVNCVTARFRSLKWIKVLEDHGAYLGHIRTDYASNAGLASFASALNCSLYNLDRDVFKYLATNHSGDFKDVCHLCTNPLFKHNFLEYTVRRGKYEQAAWLLENIEQTKDMITPKILARMNRTYRMRQDTRPHFWKAVDIVRNLGHEVNPPMSR